MVEKWLPERLALHRIALENVRARHENGWATNIGSPIDKLVPEVGAARQEEAERLRKRFPDLPNEYIQFVAYCSGFPIFGLGGSDDVRVLPPEDVESLRVFDAAFVERWLSGPTSSRRTPEYTELVRQDTHVFDASELLEAIVLIAGHNADGAVLWIPSPRREYWRVAAWEGCFRFLTIEGALNHLLSDVVAGLDAAL